MTILLEVEAIFYSKPVGYVSFDVADIDLMDRCHKSLNLKC